MDQPISLPTDDDVLAAWRDRRLGELVEQGLSILVSEPIAYLGRAVDLLWVGFGDEVHAPSRLDPKRLLARFALHVQCPFRIVRHGHCIVGQQDIYVSADAPRDTPLEFDWDSSRASLFDARVVEFNEFAKASRPRVVRVTADATGGVVIEMTDDLQLQLMPTASFQVESWRFFLPGTDAHLVVMPEA